MSPPRLTSTPQPVAARAAAAAWSDASALAVAPRSSVTPAPSPTVPRAGVGPDRPPSGHGGEGHRPDRPRQSQAPGRGHRSPAQVTVVAERDQRLAQGRVDVAVGQLGGAHGGGDRLESSGPTAHRAAGGAVERRQLGVVAKARAGPVERLHGRAGPPRPPPRAASGVGADHDGRASERREAGLVGQEPPDTAPPPAGAGCGATGWAPAPPEPTAVTARALPLGAVPDRSARCLTARGCAGTARRCRLGGRRPEAAGRAARRWPAAASSAPREERRDAGAAVRVTAATLVLAPSVRPGATAETSPATAAVSAPAPTIVMPRTRATRAQGLVASALGGRQAAVYTARYPCVRPCRESISFG